MKILVNAATAVVGGGAQVAANFIENSIKKPCGHEFLYAVSLLVAEKIKSLVGELPENTIVIKSSPAKLWHGKKSRAKLLYIEKTFSPNIVYSIAAPSYVQFKNTIELSRFTDAWLTHPNKWVFLTISPLKLMSVRLRVNYKAWALRNLNYFTVQTQMSAIGLAKRLNLTVENVRVIPNSPNQNFCDADSKTILETKNKKEAVVFVLAHPYPHKNIDIVTEVAMVLKRRGEKCKFILTLPSDNPQTKKILAKANKLLVLDMIKNVGSLTLSECKEWYSNSDIVFLPTLLETFSATYLEAMVMKRPIITTDLNFAREICGDSAEYFEPLNAEKAAKAILKVLNDKQRYCQLVENGCSTIKNFPPSNEVYKAHIEWLQEVAVRNGYTPS